MSNNSALLDMNLFIFSLESEQEYQILKSPIKKTQQEHILGN